MSLYLFIKIDVEKLTLERGEYNRRKLYAHFLDHPISNEGKISEMLYDIEEAIIRELINSIDILRDADREIRFNDEKPCELAGKAFLRATRSVFRRSAARMILKVNQYSLRLG